MNRPTKARVKVGMKTSILYLLAAVALFWTLPAAADPVASCKSAYGKTACGFSCTAAYGKVKCAQTPQGRCQAKYGKVTCWDPAPSARRRGGRRGPRGNGSAPERSAQAATCKSAYGKTACGFSCTAAYGKVACAQTPEGRCHAAYGKVVCWDPPSRRGRRHRRDGGVQAECRAAYGKIACGYACVAAYGKVQCASTPEGQCAASAGELTCFDPRG